LLLAAFLWAGSAMAKTVLVRVQARNYQELYDHVPFKGTSIDIAGAIAGKSYDLTLDESDLPLVQGCGLASEILTPDLDGWGRISLETFGAPFYCSYDSMVTIMRSYVSNYPSICSLDSFGPSYQGRWIYGVRIAGNPNDSQPQCLLIGLHHSREWAASQVPRFIMDTLITNYDSNATFHDFIDHHETWIFPIINPDGFSYDYPNELLWRKNRQPYEVDTGTDPNRDYDGCCNGDNNGDWGAIAPTSQSSHDPSTSDDVFMGGYGCYAPEINSISNFFRKHRFSTCISYHSYAEDVLWPYGYGAVTPDNTYYANVGTQVANRIKTLAGGTYLPEQSNYLYPTNSDSDPWMYGWAHYIGGFPIISFTIEVGTSFYQPTSDLPDIQTQNFNGAWYLMNHSDTIIHDLRGAVPRPILAPMDSVGGEFTIHWTPIDPAQNNPDRWELSQLSGLTVSADSIENGDSNWVLNGFTVSTSEHHSGAHSLWSGNTSNMSNSAMTKYPYPVTSPNDSVTFWTYYNLETDYDVGVVEVSREGKEWIQLDTAYTGNSGWIRKAYSLAPWLGTSVFIRFRAMSDDNTNNGGMYVDDVYPVPVFAQDTVIDSTITDTLYQVTAQAKGHYWYRVRGHNEAWGWSDKGPLQDVYVMTTGIAKQPLRPTNEYRTALNVSPSVFKAHADVAYSLARAGRVTLRIYDAAGRQVRELANSVQNPGDYNVTWDGRDAAGQRLADGIYLCRLVADKTLTSRLVLLH
jgi:carboxypeptidase T